MSTQPADLLTGPEVRAVDNTSYHHQARSQPYPLANTEGRFGAETGPNLDTAANPTDPSAVALARVLEALADLRRIFEDYFARCDQIFADLEACP